MADFLKQIEREAVLLFPKRSAILGAASGGLDSMALLHSLNTLSSRYEWRIAIAHFNHHLRGTVATADQFVVTEFANQNKLKISVGAWKKDPALIKKQGIEMAAREARYKFLTTAAKKHRCKYIAIAHHSDDQTETFLWRMMRGAGGEGLGGMQVLTDFVEKPKIQIARPLLSFTKSELSKYANDCSIPFREDSTNSDPKYLRNKIRGKLIPYLKRHFHPQIQHSILQSQDLVATDSDYAKQSAREWLDTQKQTNFSNLHVAVQRWAIWHQLIELDIDPQFLHIERLRASVEQSISVKKTKLIRRDNEGILHLDPVKPLIFCQDRKVIQLNPRWSEHKFGKLSIRCRITQKKPLDSGLELFDAEKLSKQIVLRHWKAGDRFQPIGNQSASKLQDILTNAKIGAIDKRSRVLACNDLGVPFWVQGLRIGELAKISSNTKKFLSWKWTII